MSDWWCIIIIIAVVDTVIVGYDNEDYDNIINNINKPTKMHYSGGFTKNQVSGEYQKLPSTCNNALDSSRKHSL